jgi:hypothetical protein
MRPGTGSALGLALLAGLVLAPPAGAAEPSLTAELDRRELALGESATLTVRLAGAEGPAEVRLPSGGPDLRVLSRAESTQTQVTLGGAGLQMHRVRTWTLVLEPLRRGQIRVPGPSADVGGTRLGTPDLLLEVSGAVPRPPRGGPGDDEPPPRSLDWNWRRDLTLRLVLDRREVFVGEQVTATLELVSPVEVLDWESYRPPAFDGFWSEDLGVKPSRRVDQVDGVPVRVYVLKKVALFPTRPGSLTVEPAALEVRVQIASRDPFGLLPEVRRARRQSRPVKLGVKPLPPGAPPGFEPGNVGDWSLSAELPATRPAAGQPFGVKVVARGVGNLRRLSLPRVEARPGLRVFDPSLSDEVAVKGGRFGGARTVETLVALEREGTVLLPAVAWPYFDPRSGRYRRAELPELRLEAGPAAPAPRPAAGDAAAPAAELRPLRTDGRLERRRAPPWRRAAFLAALALPPLAFAGLALGLRLRDGLASGEVARRSRRAARVARRRLAAARRRMAAGDDSGFHAEVARALTGYAADRLGAPVAGLTREELARALARAGARGPGAALLSRALEACDAGRFGGGSSMEDTARRAQEAVARLEEVEWTPGGRA